MSEDWRDALKYFSVESSDSNLYWWLTRFARNFISDINQICKRHDCNRNDIELICDTYLFSLIPYEPRFLSFKYIAPCEFKDTSKNYSNDYFYSTHVNFSFEREYAWKASLNGVPLKNTMARTGSNNIDGF